jgi:four helix bundle protein
MKQEDREQMADDRTAPKIQTVNDLKVYKLSYELVVKIFKVIKKFPKEEIYSLVDQIRRSSRSVSANIREGFAKKKYRSVFIRHLNDTLGSSEETRTWLDFARDCGYISREEHDGLECQYDEVSRMLHLLINRWQQALSSVFCFLSSNVTCARSSRHNALAGRQLELSNFCYGLENAPSP